jgi:hypothetical protein
MTLSSDELTERIKQLKFAYKDLLDDVPVEFIAMFSHLFAAKILPNKSLAEYIKLKYNTLRIIDEEL